MKHIISAIVLGCSLVISPFSLSQSIRMPGFQSGDGEKYHYFVVRFQKGGYLGNAAAVDDNGLLHLVIVDGAFVNGVAVDYPHWYIYAQDSATGANLYSFDLEDFSLFGFLQSLAMTQRRVVPPGTSSPVREPISVEVADQLYAEKVVASMQGENLTFEQTLDILRRDSGCDVIQAEGKLVIDWCG